MDSVSYGRIHAPKKKKLKGLGLSIATGERESVAANNGPKIVTYRAPLVHGNAKGFSKDSPFLAMEWSLFIHLVRRNGA